ncbi:hypothetical protein J45TS6_07650 [Paenibacillus sp. J45TS6]|nr:hypothetical protein J45TS6_07650 [Paenibacillus sp. J45TS6]
MLFIIILLGIVILILLDIRSKLPQKRNVVKNEIDKSRQIRKKLRDEQTRYNKRNNDK